MSIINKSVEFYVEEHIEILLTIFQYKQHCQNVTYETPSSFTLAKNDLTRKTMNTYGFCYVATLANHNRQKDTLCDTIVSLSSVGS